MGNKSHSKTNDTNSEFLDLLPKILDKDEDVSYEAVEELESVLSLAKKKNIRNVAIMGPFGSGKSSVINTLIEKSAQGEKEKYLKISLATLEANNESVEKAVSNHNEENKQEDSEDGRIKDKNEDEKAENGDVVNEEALNRKIEYSILQQIVYREKASTIPHSRLSRIVHFTRDELRKYACVVVLTILALFITLVALHSGINTLNQVVNMGKCWIVVIISCFCWLLWVLCEALTYLFKRVCNLRIRRLNLRELGVEWGKDESIFNKHLDEILYFFQATEYDVVFIEDLDRFNTHKIFLKLRELNYIINESKIINRHITFVYAIRDDMFRDDNRTKFFDYIITVIPIINSTNSKDMLRKELSVIDVGEGISDDDLSVMGFFIHDMRILKNIVNEYKQYKVRLGSLDLDRAKLLAMIVYKNYYPKEFSRLHRREARINECINRKEKFVKRATRNIEKKIEQLLEEEKVYSSNCLKSKEELRLVFLHELSKKVGRDVITYLIDGTAYSIDEIAQSGRLFEALRNSNNVEFRRINKTNSIYSHNLNVDMDSIDNSIHFSLRIKGLENGKAYFKNERSKLMRESLEIESLRLNELLRNYPMDGEEIYKGIGLQPMEDVFIKRGYIDENYSIYISYFYSGALSFSDHTLSLAIRQRRPIESFDYHIHNVENLVKGLSLPLFDNDAILNNELLDYIYGDRRFDDYFNRFVHYLVRSEKFVSFMSQYYTDDERKIGVFKRIINVERSDFWNNLTQEAECKEKNELLIAYLNHCGDLTNEEQEWLNVNYKFMAAYANVLGTKRCKAIVDVCMFSLLDNTNADLLLYVVDNSKYKLNINNLLVIVQEFSPSGRSTTKYNLNVTSILGVNNTRFRKYVDSNISDVLQFFTRGAIYESSDGLLYIINNENLTDRDKEKYLNGPSMRIGNIVDIKKEVWYDIAIRDNILLPIWENVATYLYSITSRKDYDDRLKDLVKYVEKNVSDLSNQKCPIGLTNASDVFAVLFVNRDGISMKNYKKLLAAFENIKLEKYESLNDLDDERMHILLDNDKIPFEDNALFVMYSTNLFAEYILLYHKEFIFYLQTNNDFKYEMSEEVATKLLKSNVFSNSEKRLILRFTPQKTKMKMGLDDTLLEIYLDTQDIQEEDKVLLKVLRNAKDLEGRIKLTIMMLNTAVDRKDMDYVLSVLGKDYLDFANGVKGTKLKFTNSLPNLIVALEKKGVMPHFQTKKEDGIVYYICD